VAVGGFFALILLGSLIAGWFMAPLTWDGSYYLFKALDLREPFTPLGRTINIVLMAPVLWAQAAGADFGILRAAFVLPYVFIPVIGLAAAWLVVEESRPELFVWPALCAGLMLLPVRFFYTSEGPMVTSLFWALPLSVLAGPRVWHLPILALLGYACWVSHPATAVLLFLTALLAAHAGWQRPRERRLQWLLAGAMLAAGAARALLPLSGYESESLSVQRLVDSFRDSVWGFPFISLVLGGVASLLVLLGTNARLRGWLGWALELLPGVLILAAGLALIPWARNLYYWAHSLDFRFWIWPIFALFIAFATLDALQVRGPERTSPPDRRWTLLATGLAFVLVLTLQGRSWMHLGGVLDQSLATLPPGCSARSLLENTGGTALDHWGTVFHVVVRQGQRPAQVVLDGEGCQLLRQTGVVRLADWDQRPAEDGWFRFPVS
jgi:hypothetical protein